MLIKRTSTLTGIEREKEISVTEEQLKAYENGGMIQKVMPNISEDDREFIMTGITPDEWNNAFSEEE